MKVERIRLLLIEDDPRQARLITTMLGSINDVYFEIENAARLSAGLQRLEKGDIDVVMLDLSLVDSTGMETLSKVQSKSPDVPVVVMTGLDDELVATEAVRRGAQDYLVKGNTDQNLISRSLRYAIERHRAQKQLKRSEERFHALLENSLDAFLVTDANLVIGYATSAFGRLFGYTADATAGTSASELVHPDDLSRLMEAVDCIKKNPDTAVTVECRYRRKDGSWQQAEASCQNLLNNPAVQGIIMHYSDPTCRKQAEQALQKAERWYRAVFDNPMNIVYIFDEKGVFLDANEAALRRFGYGREELAKMSLQNVTHPEDLPKTSAVLSEMMDKGHSETYRLRQLSKAGDAVLLEVYLTLAEKDGDHCRFLASAREITPEITKPKRRKTAGGSKRAKDS